MTQAQQTWSASRYAANARFVSDLTAEVLALLAPRHDEHILDLGCGDGVIAAALAQLGCTVVGIDASPNFIDAARARGVDARLMDGEAIDFGPDFDAVFSNAALHWMKDADAVISGVGRALRPGGRFVAEMGGADNVRLIVTALEEGLERRGIDPSPFNPWYFPTPDDYRARLEAAGFTVDCMELIDRPTTLPGDITGWLETFAGTFTAALPDDRRAAYVGEVRDSLAPRLRDSSGHWQADYVRLRFRAFKAA